MMLKKAQVAGASRLQQTGVAAAPLRPRTVQQQQRRVQMRAEEEQSSAPPAVDFTPNTQAASGYVEFDTAGQSNMYPVITRAYEAGSAADTTNQGGANLAIGVGAAVIAVAVLAVGLGALSQGGAGAGSVAEPVEQLKSLSEYAAVFAAEL